MIRHLNVEGLDRLQTLANRAYDGDREKVDKAMAAIVRGSGVLESNATSDKESVMAILATSPSVIVSAISSMPTPERMAAMVNKIADTVTTMGGDVRTVHGLIGDLSDRLPGGDPNFWQNFFQRLNAPLIPIPPTVETLAPLYQRIGSPQIRDGLVARLDAYGPPPLPGPDRWGIVLNDAIIAPPDVAGIRASKPDGTPETIAQLLLAAQNRALPADALVAPLTHAAQDPGRAQAVFPSLLSSADGMRAVTSAISGDETLANHLVDRLKAGDIKGPAAKQLRAMVDIRTKLIASIDADIAGQIAGPLRSGKVVDPALFRPTVTSLADMVVRLKNAGINGADRVEVVERWERALNQSRSAAMVMVNYFPNLAEMLNEANIRELGALRDGDVRRYAPGLSRNLSFPVVLAGNIDPDNSLLRAVSDKETAWKFLERAMENCEDGDDVDAVLDFTLNNPEFLAVPGRGDMMVALTSNLMDIGPPSHDHIKAKFLSYTDLPARSDFTGYQPGVDDNHVQKDLKVAAGLALINAGHGNELSGAALLSTIKSTGTVPRLTVQMANSLSGLDGPTVIRFVKKYPDLAFEVKQAWPAGANPLPAAINAMNAPGQDRGVSEVNLAQILAMPPDKIDMVTVELMLQHLNSSDLDLGATVAEISRTVDAIPEAVIWHSNALKVLASKTMNKELLINRLSQMASGVDDSELAARTQVTMDKLRRKLTNEFSKMRNDPADGNVSLADQCNRLQFVARFCGQDSAPGTDRAMLIDTFLSSQHIPRDFNKAAPMIMEALKEVGATDESGQALVKDILVAFMKRSDGHAASVMELIGSYADLSTSVLNAVNELKTGGGWGTDLRNQIQAYVLKGIGFGSGADISPLASITKGTPVREFLKANMVDVLGQSMRQNPKKFDREMNEFIPYVLKDQKHNADILTAVGKLIGSAPVISRGVVWQTNSWVPNTMSALTQISSTDIQKNLDTKNKLKTKDSLTPYLKPLIEAGILQHPVVGRKTLTEAYQLTRDGIDRLEAPTMVEKDAKLLQSIADVTDKDIEEVKAALLAGKRAHDQMMSDILDARSGKTVDVGGVMLGSATEKAPDNGFFGSIYEWMFPSSGPVQYKDPSLEQTYVAKSILAKYPDEAKKMRKDDEIHPVNDWAPRIDQGRMNNDELAHAARLLAGGGPSALTVHVRNYGTSPLDFSAAVTKLETEAARTGLSEKNVDFVAAPMTHIHAAQPKLNTPDVLAKSALQEPADEHDEGRAELALKGYMLAMGLSENAETNRPLAQKYPARTASMGINLDRIDQAKDRIRALIASDAEYSAGKDVSGQRILTALAAEGYSITDIMVASRSLEVDSLRTSGFKGHQSVLIKIGPDALMEAAVSAAEHRAKILGHNADGVRQELATDLVMIRNLAIRGENKVWNSLAVALVPVSPHEPSTPLSGRIDRLENPPEAKVTQILREKSWGELLSGLEALL